MTNTVEDWAYQHYCAAHVLLPPAQPWSARGCGVYCKVALLHCGFPEPMYPQVCRTTPVFSPSSDKLHSHCLPTELMRTITSLNCSLSCQKEDPLSLMQLIIEVKSFRFSDLGSADFLVWFFLVAPQFICPAKLFQVPDLLRDCVSHSELVVKHNVPSSSHFSRSSSAPHLSFHPYLECISPFGPP